LMLTSPARLRCRYIHAADWQTWLCCQSRLIHNSYAIIVGPSLQAQSPGRLSVGPLLYAEKLGVDARKVSNAVIRLA